jgi:hypothetical protein
MPDEEARLTEAQIRAVIFISKFYRENALPPPSAPSAVRSPEG